MNIRTQILTILNLDKCLGCHTCSITCKNVWTSRKGTEYIWFNNVETKPGVGYPKQWENQEKWNGGWKLRGDTLMPRQGGRLTILAKIFSNPNLPTINDYYEPFHFKYGDLQKPQETDHFPTLRPYSAITGEKMNDITWGANWEDSLGGEFHKRKADHNFRGMNTDGLEEFEKTFMMYLPRLCEHCMNPACMASCPSGAIYKRADDGAVLVDQNKCSGWRMCISGCPYKKIYYNWEKNKSEKCIQCYPRMESGECSICSDTCVGRIRYQGIVLYDADRVKSAASGANAYESQLDIILDPHDPAVISKARECGISDVWLDYARRSPVYKMAKEWKIAFPLHPEYRTLPMAWYVPPLSAVKHNVDDMGQTVENMRLPVMYLANLLTDGDVKPIKKALDKLLSLRMYKRAARLSDNYIMPDKADKETLDDMYRLLAVAKHDDRFVIPTSDVKFRENLNESQGNLGFTGPNKV